MDRLRAVIDPVTMVHRGGLGTDAVNGDEAPGLHGDNFGLRGGDCRRDAEELRKGA